MRTAIEPDNSSNPLKLIWYPVNVTDQFLIYLHFSEVQTLHRNQTREFDIYLNGDLWSQFSISPFNRSTTTLPSASPEKSASKYEIQIQKTNRSTLPPIINAAELYAVKQFLHLQTDDEDGKLPLSMLFFFCTRSTNLFSFTLCDILAGSIMDIKSVYKVQKGNWQGDPCSPKAYAWNGVGCSYNGSDLPRITSLYALAFSFIEPKNH